MAFPPWHGSFTVSVLRGQFCVLQGCGGRAAIHGKGEALLSVQVPIRQAAPRCLFLSLRRNKTPHSSISSFLKSQQSFSSCITPSPLAAVSLAPWESGGRLCAGALGNHRAVASEPLPPLEPARSPDRMTLFKHKQVATAPCLQLWNISLHRHRGGETTQQAPVLHGVVISRKGSSSPVLSSRLHREHPWPC